jgi:hypothetical protein
VGDGLSFGAEIGRFGALRITRPGSYMVGLRKKLTFSHQQAIKWQSLEEKEIFEFRPFSAPNSNFCKERFSKKNLFSLHVHAKKSPFRIFHCVHDVSLSLPGSVNKFLKCKKFLKNFNQILISMCGANK